MDCQRELTYRLFLTESLHFNESAPSYYDLISEKKKEERVEKSGDEIVAEILLKLKES